MTINILEKVGEITITELRSAKENNFIATEEQARQAEIKRLEEEKKEKERQEQAAKFLPKLVDRVNSAAERGDKSICLLWKEGEPKPCGIEYCVLEKIYETIKSILESVGYSVYLHTYSKSWTTRSGKFGELTVSWYTIEE